MVEKIDFKKKYKTLFNSPKKPVIIKVPKLQFLMIDGKGYPENNKEYTNAIQSLYPIAYTLKFMSKEKGKDYVVPPLEGLWWAENMNNFTKDKSSWKWTMMIMQPDWITKEMLKKAIKKIKEKKEIPISIDKVRLEKYEEGKSAQIMHIGSYSEEGDNIKKIHDLIKEQNGKFNGKKQKHHEIYLSDPRKVKPEKLKTIIRQPFV